MRNTNFAEIASYIVKKGGNCFMKKKFDITTIISLVGTLLTIAGGVVGGIATKRQMKSQIAAEVAKAVTKE